MPRVDDYLTALDMAARELRNRNPDHSCRRSGAQFTEKGSKSAVIELSFLNRTISITWPELVFSEASGKEVPLKERILILHYLNGSQGGDPTGEWIAYQDIPSARFYLDAFNRRVKHPLVKGFGEQPDKLLPLASELYGASAGSLGDASVLVHALPKIPITLVIWRGDEEFSPDGAVLFDRTVQDILSAEDISELSSMIVYPLLAKLR
jgi:hypothetical protein